MQPHNFAFASVNAFDRCEKSRESKSGQTAPIAGRTESEIAAVAYRLWQENGCPAGSDQEDWFRAEELLNSAQVAKRDDPPSPPAPNCGAGSEPEMRTEYLMLGHWEVWEREWGGPRWVCDTTHTMH